MELEATIASLRSTAKGVRETGERMQFLARVVDGDVPLAKVFRDTGDPWGVAARDTDRQAFGGPAIIPTQWQLIKLARDAERAAERGVGTTTFPDAMQGVGIGWESEAASARRRRERDAAVAVEVLRTQCKTCEAGDGEQCRTKEGRVAEQPHVGRQREAEATVDARLGYLGVNPVAVPDDTWNSRRASVLSWLAWCRERGYECPAVPAWARRLGVPDSGTPARSRMAIDRLIARRDVHLREKTLYRMLHGTAARSDEILGVNIEDLDFAGRRCQVKAKGARTKARRRGRTREDFVRETVHWDAGTARLLPACSSVH